MKRKLFTIISACALAFTTLFGFGLKAEAAENVVYVSVDGQSTNDGSQANPKDINSAINGATAGTTVILQGGTYQRRDRFLLTAKGTASSRITVKAAENARVIIDFSQMEFNSLNRGVQLQGSFWTWYGIEITGAGDNGMYISGSNNIIENCQFYRNRDTGLQLGRAGGSDTNINKWPSNNLIKNCTSFDNYDELTPILNKFFEEKHYKEKWGLDKER